jgi:hypothetical protein
MSELMNLDLENKNILSSLEKGQCIVRINSLKFPFPLKIPLVKRNYLTVSEINKRNDEVLKMKNLIPNRYNKRSKIFNRFQMLEQGLKRLVKTLIFLKLEKVSIENKDQFYTSINDRKSNKILENEKFIHDCALYDTDIIKLSKLIDELHRQQNTKK